MHNLSEPNLKLSKVTGIKRVSVYVNTTQPPRSLHPSLVLCPLKHVTDSSNLVCGQVWVPCVHKQNHTWLCTTMNHFMPAQPKQASNCKCESLLSVLQTALISRTYTYSNASSNSSGSPSTHSLVSSATRIEHPSGTVHSESS